MTGTTLFLASAGGYLLGSIPFSFLVARAFGVADVRRVGSGNVGATNVLRSAGPVAGILAFLLDALKGAGAALAAERLGAGGVAAGALAAAAAVLGHMYPPWLSFHGGKGVATGAGAFLPLAPGATAAALVVFALTLGITRYVSLGSILGALALPAAVYWLGGPPVVTIAAAGLGVLIAVKHRGNLSRIVAGTEPRLGASRS